MIQSFMQIVGHYFQSLNPGGMEAVSLSLDLHYQRAKLLIIWKYFVHS